MSDETNGNGWLDVIKAVLAERFSKDWLDSDRSILDKDGQINLPETRNLGDEKINLQSTEVGGLKLTKVKTVDYQPLSFADDDINTTREIEVTGTLNGNEFSGIFRLNRRWRNSLDGWQIYSANITDQDDFEN